MPNRRRYRARRGHVVLRDDAHAVVDSRSRLRHVVFAFGVLLSAVYLRMVWLEVQEGAVYRDMAARPVERQHRVPALRGRILARDGTVLARDRRTTAVAVAYRWIEEPPNERWLRITARRQLSPDERRDDRRMESAMAEIRVTRNDLHRRLAALCGVSDEQWAATCRRTQRRVERIAESVNRAHRQRVATTPTTDARDETTGEEATARGWWARTRAALGDAFRSPTSTPTRRITIAEELDAHVIVERVGLEVVAEIERDPQRYPGVRLVERTAREYPRGDLAAHLLGHMGAMDPADVDRLVDSGDARGDYTADDWIGQMGVEAAYEAALRGRAGERVEFVTRAGDLLAERDIRSARQGADVMVTVDPAVQLAAADLLDAALARQRALPGRRTQQEREAGGAVIVMDVENGDVLAAASAPRFDPNVFAAKDRRHVAALLEQADRPLFDRATMMAIPPGSVFKVATALALLDGGSVDPNDPFHCRGYLHHPNRDRCFLYTRYGIGHDATTMTDALAESCNVYFFHHATELGVERLVDWSSRLGFGRATGIDVPGEVRGTLPHPRNIRELSGHTWRTGDTRALAIGQSALTVTPLQIVRMMAAVANGGKLLTPRVRLRTARVYRDGDAPQLPVTAPVARWKKVKGVDTAQLAIVREGLQRAVADPDGTAHATVNSTYVAIAGKTGTAQTGAGREDHAWFAGYAPADAPEVAIVVVLEHAGGGGEVAGPVAKRLIEAMAQRGYFGRRRGRRLAATAGG